MKNFVKITQSEFIKITSSDFVEITSSDFDIILDLRYASKNNVCGELLYSKPKCYLHFETAELLKKAIKIAKNENLKIKIFDGYRPLKVQSFMFNKFLGDKQKDGFVSNPKNGAIPHCRGVAIDLTLVDKNNQELEMGSDFDEFSELAFHDFAKISDEAKANRQKLLQIMTDAGFDFYQKEWWHYQLFKPREYKVIEDFENLSFIK